MSRIETIGNATLYLGDCLDVLKTLPTNSVDSVVCDPPYGLSFMGKKWDYDVPSVEIWAECLRVLKPGGHLLAFAGTRTQHRMAVRIEDAGFEIRDMIAWVYGSGFPKSLDVSKAIDRAAGKLAPEGQGFTVAGYSHNPDKLLHTAPSRGYVPPLPATPEAEQWKGWGTALKPALEPITVARKPLVGTVAANVLEHGTGALNIDGCRVATDDKLGGGSTSADVDRTGTHEGWQRPWMADAEAAKAAAERRAASVARSEALGRWPANIIHDGSSDVVAAFPDSNGSGTARVLKRGAKTENNGWGMNTTAADFAHLPDAGTGSAARFFYAAKASKKDREEGLDNAPQKTAGVGDERPSGSFNERLGKTPTAPRANNHPTVKPTDLMAYLCRLVTPPGGVVLDPFMGSGSTGKAAIPEGFHFIGVECEPAYFDIACRRIDQAHAQGQLFEPTQSAPVQLGLEAA